MRKLFCIVIALMCILLMVSCSAPEDDACVIQLTTYYSLDEFLAAAKTTSDSKDDSSSFTAYTDIHFPTAIPSNYKLYKITAGSDVAFWYLPEEYLTNRDTILEAEAFQKHFMYIDSINLSFDSFVKQLGGHPSNLLKDKYFLTYTSSCMINWEESGRLLSLYLPATLEVSDDMIVSTAEAEEDTYTCISINELCQTELIIIDKDEAIN